MAAVRVRKTGELRATCGGRVGHPSLDCAQNLILHILTAEFIRKYRKKCQHKKKASATDFVRKKKTFTTRVFNQRPTKGMCHAKFYCAAREHVCKLCT